MFVFKIFSKCHGMANTFTCFCCCFFVVVVFLVCHGLFVKGHPGELSDLIQVSNGYICGIVSVDSAAP